MSNDRTTKEPLEWEPGELIQGWDPHPEKPTKKWYGMDSRSSFLTNLRGGRVDPYYHELEIDYEFNAQGYRVPHDVGEYTENYFISFGCSETFGVGNRREDLWCTLLEKSTGVKNLNLAVQASGLGFHLHNTIMYLEKYEQRPEFVLYQHPEVCRRIYATDDRGYIHMDTDKIHSWDYFQHESNQHEVTDYVRNACYTMILDRLWKAEGVPVIHFGIDTTGCTPYYDMPAYEILDAARDCSHAGYRTHQAVARELLQKLDYQPDLLPEPNDRPLTEEELLKQRIEEMRKRDPFVYR
jgi:hypothetical protein